MRILFFCLVWLPFYAGGQDYPLVADWNFHPNYQLPGNAGNIPGHVINAPQSRFQRFTLTGPAIQMLNEYPTQRISDIPLTSPLPLRNFSLEMWMLNHVNMPVGLGVAARNFDQVAWFAGIYDKEVFFELGDELAFDTLMTNSWKKYWTHLVITFDGAQVQLFLNGQLIVDHMAKPFSREGENLQLEISGYFQNEPYMQISNLLKRCRIYHDVISSDFVQDRFLHMQQDIEKGRLFDRLFHFNAGPYLNYVTGNSINLIWETDRRAGARVEFGSALPFNRVLEIEEPRYIQECTLDDLEENTLYYYQITSMGEFGDTMNSGILTFKTAVAAEDPLTFCIIGDTESRPHINHRLSEMIWDERPDFLIHLGDITDGGFESHKFEWNLEYFTGMTALVSRIPTFPVAGNGEGDLFWYKRYHRLPEPESYYSFTYGNTEFFMLNSNAREELSVGGSQYEWLKEKLRNSTATWKFVAHHHCPFSSDENDFGNTWKGERSSGGDPRFDDLKKLYQAGNVDAVFYGHVHAYERSYPLTDGKVDQENGVLYIKSGGAGGNLEDFTPGRFSFSSKVQRGNHYCRINISDNVFDLKVFDLEGRLNDFFQLTK